MLLMIISMSEFTIKKVKKYDFLALISYLFIRWQVFIGEFNRGVFEEFCLEDIKASHYNFLIDNQVAGIARIIIRDDRLELGRIAIKKEYRHQGNGKKFVNHLIEEIRNTEQIKIISLFVAESSLIKFYQQFSFFENGEVYFKDTTCVNMIRVL